MEKNNPRLRFAAKIAILGIMLQMMAFIIPYLEYFSVVNFGFWFLGFALFLNLLSIFCLLYFFIAFYQDSEK